MHATCLRRATQLTPHPLPYPTLSYPFPLSLCLRTGSVSSSCMKRTASFSNPVPASTCSSRWRGSSARSCSAGSPTPRPRAAKRLDLPPAHPARCPRAAEGARQLPARRLGTQAPQRGAGSCPSSGPRTLARRACRARRPVHPQRPSDATAPALLPAPTACWPGWRRAIRSLLLSTFSTPLPR
jgi:hypothetical protein